MPLGWRVSQVTGCEHVRQPSAYSTRYTAALAQVNAQKRPVFSAHAGERVKCFNDSRPVSPAAADPARQCYHRHRAFSKRSFVKALQRLIPELRAEDLEWGRCGVRAQALLRDGRLEDDFVTATFALCPVPTMAASSTRPCGINPVMAYRSFITGDAGFSWSARPISLWTSVQL